MENRQGPETRGTGLEAIDSRDVKDVAHKMVHASDGLTESPAIELLALARLYGASAGAFIAASKSEQDAIQNAETIAVLTTRLIPHIITESVHMIVDQFGGAGLPASGAGSSITPHQRIDGSGPTPVPGNDTKH